MYMKNQTKGYFLEYLEEQFVFEIPGDIYNTYMGLTTDSSMNMISSLW